MSQKKQKHIADTMAMEYEDDFKTNIIKSISEWHNSRIFWFAIAAFCFAALAILYLVSDRHFYASLCEEFMLIRASFFTICVASLICAIYPKNIFFKIGGYCAGIVGAVFSIKHCCLLWAIYKTSDVQEHIVRQKSPIEIFRCLLNIDQNCGLKVNGIAADKLYGLTEQFYSGVQIIPHYIFMDMIYFYMAVFVVVLLALYTAFVCSAIKKYLMF